MERNAKIVLLALAAGYAYKTQNDAAENAKGPGSPASTPSLSDDKAKCNITAQTPLVEITASSLMRRFSAGDASVYCTRFRVVITEQSELHFFGKMLANLYLLTIMTSSGDSRVDAVSVDRMVNWFKFCRWDVFPAGYMKLRAEMEPLQAEAFFYRQHDLENNLPMVEPSPGRFQYIINKLNNEYMPKLTKWHKDWAGFPLLKLWSKTTRAYGGQHLGFGADPWSPTGYWMYTQGTDLKYPPIEFGGIRHNIGLTSATKQLLIKGFQPGIHCLRMGKSMSGNSNWSLKDGIPPQAGREWFECFSTQAGGRSRYNKLSWSEPGGVADNYLRDVIDWRIFAAYAGNNMLHEYALARFLQLFYLRGINLQGGEQAAKDLLGLGVTAMTTVGMGIAGSTSPAGWVAIGVKLISDLIGFALKFESLKTLERATWHAAKEHAPKAMARFGLKLEDLPAWKHGLNFPGLRADKALRAKVISDPWQYFIQGLAPQLPMIYLMLDFDFPMVTSYHIGHTQFSAFRVTNKPDYPRWQLGVQSKPRF